MKHVGQQHWKWWLKTWNENCDHVTSLDCDFKIFVQFENLKQINKTISIRKPKNNFKKWLTNRTQNESMTVLIRYDMIMGNPKFNPEISMNECNLNNLNDHTMKWFLKQFDEWILINRKFKISAMIEHKLNGTNFASLQTTPHSRFQFGNKLPTNSSLEADFDFCWNSNASKSRNEFDTTTQNVKMLNDKAMLKWQLIQWIQWCSNRFQNLLLTADSIYNLFVNGCILR